MRKVRINSLMAGPDGCFRPGAEITVSEEKAEALVTGGYAEYLDQPEKAPKQKSKEKE